MTIDFTKIKVKDITGEIRELDLSKELGNVIFQTTKDLGELEIARAIYLQGHIDADQKTVEMIIGYIEDNFVAFVKEALIPILQRCLN